MRMASHILRTPLGLLLAWGAASAQTTQINISQDLVTLGIATTNATPNNARLDSRPLLQAAIQYASDNRIGRVTADPGGYWFLTAQKSDRYLVLDHVSDLIIDLQGSEIYLKSNFMIGFNLVSCQRVTLANFSIDYEQLPYTQVRLTGASGRALSYDTISGWPSPTALRAKFGGNEYWGIVFRGGTVPANTNRLPLAKPTDTGVLQVNADGSPWTQPGVLNTYQPGDILVVTLKDGGAAVLVERGDTVVLSGLDIYASGTLGVHLDSTWNSAVFRVRVMPRPGTDRLISTNADGIHLSYVQANNRVQYCYVSRTMDDAITLNSPFLAFVDRAVGARGLSVVRNFQARVPNGTSLAFINPNTGETLGPLQLVGQSPPFEASPTFNSNATYTFDGNLPAVQTGFGVVFADPTNRGAGSLVENNLVEDVVFARGIFLGGVSGVTVQKNTIRRTDCGGIVLHHDLSGYPTAANQDILVNANTVDAAIGPAAVGTGAIAALGSIFVLSTDASFVELKNPTATNISITNNYISNSGRTAIWAGNIDGGSIQGNTFAGFSLYPQLAIWGVTQAFATQLVQDFTQPVVVRSSRNVSVQRNQ